MMRLLRAALAAVSLCLALPAIAQDPRGKAIYAPAGFLTGTAIYCDDGTNHAVLCSFNGNGPGGSSSNASHSLYTATAGGTGYSAGDLIDRIVVSDPTSGNVSGTFWIDLTTGAKLASAPSLANLALFVQPVSGGVLATQSGAWTVGITGSVAVTGTFWQATQPISVSTLPLPSGAATSAKQDSLLAAVGSPYQAGGALPLPSGAATATGQATNTAAITATQAVPGTLAGTATTVTMTLPQLTTSAGLAISFGTTAATLFNANASRRFIAVQVQGTGSGGCYINGTTTATADANSLYIPAGGYFESSTHVGTGAVSIICTAASTPVYSRQG